MGLANSISTFIIKASSMHPWHVNVYTSATLCLCRCHCQCCRFLLGRCCCHDTDQSCGLHTINTFINHPFHQIRVCHVNYTVIYMHIVCTTLYSSTKRKAFVGNQPWTNQDKTWAIATRGWEEKNRRWSRPCILQLTVWKLCANRWQQLQ